MKDELVYLKQNVLVEPLSYQLSALIEQHQDE